MEASPQKPPKWARKFLLWFLKPELAEEVEGDLYEMFCYTLEGTSPFKAKLNYWYQVLQYLRLFAFKQFQLTNPFPFPMYFNYLKVAFRQFNKNKLTYFINSMGLGIALACCICAYLLFAHDIEFDSFHDSQKMSTVFKVHQQVITPSGDLEESISAPIPLAPQAIEDIPGIAQYSRYLFTNGTMLLKGKSDFNEAIAFADNSFFDMFEFPLESGSITSFKQKNSVFLSSTLAQKLFGEKEAIGQDLAIYFPNDTTLTLTVAAVLNKIPVNSTFEFEAIVPFENYLDLFKVQAEDWGTNPQPSTFVKLTSADVADQVNTQMEKYSQLRNEAITEAKVQSYHLVPFHANYTYKDITDSGYVNLRLGFLTMLIFGILAGMILLIACFNLTNTSIALSQKRLKEIGIRKSVGANVRQIFGQFIVESILVMLISLFLGVGLFSKWMVAEFSTLSNFEYGIEDLNGLNLFIALVILVFVASLLAGIYPALYNSRLQPSALFKSKIQLKGTNWMSRTLISAQFALTVVFFIAGIIFYQNMDYLSGMDYGYAKDEIVSLSVNDPQQTEVLRHEISSFPEVQQIGFTASHIGYGMEKQSIEVGGDTYEAHVMSVGENYLESMGISLLQGRFLQAQSAYDLESGLVVNEAFLNMVGVEASMSDPIRLEKENRQIVGVVSNHINDLENSADKPIMYQLAAPSDYQLMVIRTGADQKEAVRTQLGQLWQAHYPDKPFECRFQESLVLYGYQQANIFFGKVFFFLSIFGIILSVSGIFSLASLNVAKRLKEIGIRKVLGAGVGRIVDKVNREFVILLSIAAILGGIGGVLLTDTLLASIYQYHTSTSIFIAMLAALAVFMTGWLATSMTILKAARANPARSLSSE